MQYNLQKMGIYLIASILIAGLSFLKFRGDLWISTLLLLIFGGIIFWNEKEELKRFLHGDSQSDTEIHRD